MVQLGKDPSGDDVMKSSNNTNNATMTATLEDKDNSDEVANLKLQISTLEKRLAEVL